MATDLTGQVFGRLTVLRQSETMYISPSGKKRDRRWVCRCTCGNEVTVREDGLKSGQTRSCGCLQREAAARNKIDLTGKRFGRLTVLKSIPLEHPEKGGTVNGWLCRCDCGNEKIVTPSHLLRGGTMSCGCLSLEKNAARTNPEGQNILGRYNGTVVSLIDPKRKINSNNTSGVKGVYWNGRDNTWVARISVQGRRIYLEVMLSSTMLLPHEKPLKNSIMLQSLRNTKLQRLTRAMTTHAMTIRQEIRYERILSNRD